MKYFSVIIITFLLISCKNKTVAATDECYTDFEDFFEKFSTDSIYQKNHVKFPLKSTYLNSGGDYELESKAIPEKDYLFIDFEKHKAAKNNEFEAFKVFTEKKGDTMFYSYRGIDNGIHGDIKFVFENDCWQLVAIDDSST